MYWLRKRLLSQNFLTNRQLVKQLIRNSSIGKEDLILEIGPGQGIITQELTQVAGQVKAIEIDPRLYQTLTKQFSDQKNLKVAFGDFLHTPLPQGPYKVFSNTPFRITSDVIRKLLYSPNPPKDCYLIVQKEAANKFTTNPICNSMASILFYPWFDIKITHRFKHSDFTPKPNVDCVLLQIQPRKTPLWSGRKETYQDFVSHTFTRNRSAKSFSIDKWVNLAKNISVKDASAIRGSFSKLQKEQQNLQKVHRTRLDKNWKKYYPKI